MFIKELKDRLGLGIRRLPILIELYECFDDLSFFIRSFLLLTTLKYARHSAGGIEAIFFDCEDFQCLLTLRSACTTSHLRRLSEIQPTVRVKS